MDARMKTNIPTEKQANEMNRLIIRNANDL